jgi:uncharacterized protein
LNLFLLLFFLLFLICQSELEASVQFPRPTGLVNDFANVVQPVQRQQLTQILTELRQKTTVEIAVVSVVDMQGLDLESYATELFAAWGIGSANEDEGILILLGLDESDRGIRVEVGYGAEAYLTDGMAGQLIDEHVMSFLIEGNFGEGLFRAGLVFASFVSRVKDVELTGAVLPSTNPAHTEHEISPIVGFVFLGVFVLLIIVTRGKILIWLMLFAGGGRRGGRGGTGRSSGFGGTGRSGGFSGGRSGGGGVSRRF